jgi:uncharacterized protein DUF955
VFDRGFKAWCENVSLQQRHQLGLPSHGPLDPHQLARRMGIQVVRPEQIPGVDPSCLRVLLRDDPDSWSAITISEGSKCVIVLNSAHSGGRPASDLMHELAHILAGHTPSRVDVSEDGLLMLNTYNGKQEDEANWFAGCLLLPRVALERIHQQGLELKLEARRYGVSLAMLQYRLKVAGVERQFGRHRAR